MCAILPICESQTKLSLLKAFMDIIPSTLAPEQKTKPEDFTRARKLPFPRLIATILSLVADGTRNGVDIHAGAFFRDARRSGLWPNVKAIHRSALTKARKKVPWEVFQNTLNDAVQLAYELWPDATLFTWHGMSVFAIDGSKYTLPATPALRQEFDPNSGLGNPGKGHYPQCLVSTLYDVFRRLPIARTIKSIHTSERDEVAHLLPFMPENSILLCDRGYPSYDMFRRLSQTLNGYFLFRSPASSTFPAVEEFVASGKHDAIVWITPTNSVLRNATAGQRKSLKALKLRVILLKSPDGNVSVLITNLLNTVTFPCTEIIALYVDRWEVEE